MDEGREGGREKEGRRVSIFFIRLPSSRISLGPDNLDELEFNISGVTEAKGVLLSKGKGSIRSFVTSLVSEQRKLAPKTRLFSSSPRLHF